MCMNLFIYYFCLSTVRSHVSASVLSVQVGLRLRCMNEESSQKGTLILGGIADFLGTEKSNYTMFM